MAKTKVESIKPHYFNSRIVNICLIFLIREAHTFQPNKNITIIRHCTAHTSVRVVMLCNGMTVLLPDRRSKHITPSLLFFVVIFP